jgi:hypothetical protein
MDIVRNTLNVKEVNSGKTYTFHFRTPEIDEVLDSMKRMRAISKLEEEARQEALVKVKLDCVDPILTGIGEGQFDVELDGKEIFLSSGIGDWKGILRRRYYYLLFAVFDDAFSRRGATELEKK